MVHGFYCFVGGLQYRRSVSVIIAVMCIFDSWTRPGPVLFFQVVDIRSGA
jgi:hypothetical protein